MAPKRPSAAAEETTESSNPRRSSRTSIGGAAPTAAATVSKSGEGKVKVADKTEAPKDKDDQKEDGAPAPAAKKAKTSGSRVYKVGDLIDDIVLQNENDEPVSLKSLYDENGLVIFSYPRANTPGCTNQACGYRDIFAEFGELGWKVLGLSTDKPTAQLNWKKGKQLQYSLLSDPKRELLSRLGATEAKKRCHWVIEKGGRLAEQDIGVKPASDPTNALNIVKALSAVANGKLKK